MDSNDLALKKDSHELAYLKFARWYTRHTWYFCSCAELFTTSNFKDV